MNRITSVPAVTMNMQPDPHSNQQLRIAVNEADDKGGSFLKYFESYLQEATASPVEDTAQSQAADILNWQYMITTLPLRPKVKLAAGQN